MGPTAVLMMNLLDMVDFVLNLYGKIIIVSAVLSWLIAFNVINTRNHFVANVADFLYRITEPAMRLARRVVPPMNGIDLSPLVVLFAIWLIEILLNYAVTLAIQLMVANP